MTAKEKLLEDTKGLVAKWEKTGLLDRITDDLHPNPNMAILLPSCSTLIFDDGYRIDYMTEEEKERKLKEYEEWKIAGPVTAQLGKLKAS
jgi:hypothetical protein